MNVEHLERALRDAKQLSMDACAEAERRMVEWRSAYKEAQDENHRLQAEVDRAHGYEHELDRVMRRLRELEADGSQELREVRSALLMKSKEASDLMSQLGRVRSELDGSRPFLQSQLAGAQETIQTLHLEIISHKSAVAAAESTCGALQDKVRRLESKLEEEQRHLALIMQRKSAIQDENYSLSHQLYELEAERARLHDKNSDHARNEETQVLHGERNRSMTTIEPPAVDLVEPLETDLGAEVARLRSEMTVLERRLQKSDMDRNVLIAKLDDHRRDSATQRDPGDLGEVAELRGELEELEEVFGAALTENLQLEEVVEELRAAVQQARSVDGSEEKLSRLKRQHTAEVRELQRMLHEAIGESVALEEVAGQETVDNSAIVERVHRTEQWLDDVSEQCKAKDRVIAERNEEIEVREEHMQRLQQELYEQSTAQQAQLQASQTLLEESRASLAERNTERDALRHQLQFLQDQFKQREAEL
eukprot:TRINITY_DN19928_c0_g1_i2.p1 TRINITY_DN19928_c0_g1~~TRINITY_DN19928_c0_g1_i2.p1  ORF type:complete len:479 (+),score=152.08 TRINITY_DN19928_c0_g1_i2:339-1775(+)